MIYDTVSATSEESEAISAPEMSVSLTRYLLAIISVQAEIIEQSDRQSDELYAMQNLMCAITLLFVGVWRHCD